MMLNNRQTCWKSNCLMMLMLMTVGNLVRTSPMFQETPGLATSTNSAEPSPGTSQDAPPIPSLPKDIWLHHVQTKLVEPADYRQWALVASWTGNPAEFLLDRAPDRLDYLRKLLDRHHLTMEAIAQEANQVARGQDAELGQNQNQEEKAHPNQVQHPNPGHAYAHQLLHLLLHRLALPGDEAALSVAFNLFLDRNLPHLFHLLLDHHPSLPTYMPVGLILRRAIAKGQLSLVSRLLRPPYSLDPYAPPIYGGAVLENAIENRREGMAIALWRDWALDPRRPHFHPIGLAVVKGMQELVRLFYEGMEVNEAEGGVRRIPGVGMDICFGLTAAIWHRELALLKFLLDKGCLAQYPHPALGPVEPSPLLVALPAYPASSLILPNTIGNPPTGAARSVEDERRIRDQVRFEEAEVVRLLVKYGSDSTVQEYLPFRRAISRGWTAIVKLMWERMTVEQRETVPWTSARFDSIRKFVWDDDSSTMLPRDHEELRQFLRSIWEPMELGH